MIRETIGKLLFNSDHNRFLKSHKMIMKDESNREKALLYRRYGLDHMSYAGMHEIARIYSDKKSKNKYHLFGYYYWIKFRRLIFIFKTKYFITHESERF